MIKLRTCLALLGLWLVVGTGSASAQELLWSKLPEDGSWVRFYGVCKNLQERPESNEGPLELSWPTELTIKSVGTEEVEIGGTKVPCRWIEFKKVLGYQSAEGIKPGPFGVRIYKVLIPEDKVTGQLVDGDRIPVTFIPVIKGYRKTGDQPVQAIREKVLVTYPTLALLPHFKKLSPSPDQADEESINLPQLGAVTARHCTGKETVETETLRSVNEGEVWLSPELPFGLARYKVKLIREEKEDTDSRNDFKKTAEIDVDMVAVEKGTDAQSEIADTDAANAVVVKPLKKQSPKAAADKAADAEEPAEEMEGEEMPAEGEASEEMPAEDPDFPSDKTEEDPDFPSDKSTDKPAEEDPDFPSDKPAKESE